MSHNSFKFLQAHGNPPNSDLSSKQCCPPLEQLGPEFVSVAQGLSLRQPEKLRVFDLRDTSLFDHPSPSHQTSHFVRFNFEPINTAHDWYILVYLFF